jgi:hypothetical protein
MKAMKKLERRDSFKASLIAGISVSLTAQIQGEGSHL